MKERPISYSGLMVKAILDDHKTQTRRVVRFRKNTEQDIREHQSLHEVTSLTEGSVTGWFWHDNGQRFSHEDVQRFTEKRYTAAQGIKCPYGQIGDRLWVRETWALHPVLGGALYRADNPLDDDGEPVIEKWRPSIFMPRVHSRILLEITGVRVERIQSIATNGGMLQPDIRAEGVGTLCNYAGRCNSGRCPEHERAERIGLGYHSGVNADFKRLWDKINEPRGFGWEINPWVWVIEFKRI